MDRALRDYTGKKSKRIDEAKFAPPPGVIQVEIDPETGKLARPESARVALEWYRAGTEPKDYTPDQIILDPDEMDIFDVDTPL